METQVEIFDLIQEKILKSIPDAKVIIQDPRNDGVHLQAIVISDTFEGMSLVKQQQAVMTSLKELFESGLHALGLKTYTQSKWKEIGENHE